MATDDSPYRIVDAHNQGWLHTGDGVYRADYDFQRELAQQTLDGLRRERGPIRPVLPVTDDDVQTLRAAFAQAGRRTVATIAAALEEVFHQTRESAAWPGTAHSSYEYAMRTLTAGREGSWESEVLKDIVLFGNGLNLAPTKRGADNSIEARRAAGPSKRVDIVVRGTLVEVFGRWVSDPARYTEVAETLAWVVSRYADDTGGADGWRAIADQWLQPGALAHEDFSRCYRLLYSLSEHLDTNVF